MIRGGKEPPVILETPHNKLYGWSPFRNEDIRRLRSHWPNWRLWELADPVWPLPYDAFVGAFWPWLQSAVRAAENRTGLLLQPTQAHRDLELDAQVESDGLAVPFFSSLVYLATKRHMARLGISGHSEAQHGEPSPFVVYRDSGRYVLARPLYPPVLSRADLYPVHAPPGYTLSKRMIIVPHLGLPLDPDLPWPREEPEPEGTIWFVAARCDPKLQEAVHEAHRSLAAELERNDETGHVCELWKAAEAFWTEARTMLATASPDDLATGYCDAPGCR